MMKVVTVSADGENELVALSLDVNRAVHQASVIC